MKGKCEKCDRPATVHMTEIIGGEKIEKHLCEQCAMTAGITIKANVPISQMLEDFVLATSNAPEEAPLSCDYCGITFSEFRSKGLLGCPNDYDALESQLLPIIRRAQENAEHHVGKVPCRAGDDQVRQTNILRLRAQLRDAVAAENYELAARLRDQIKEVEP